MWSIIIILFDYFAFICLHICFGRVFLLQNLLISFCLSYFLSLVYITLLIEIFISSWNQNTRSEHLLLSPQDFPFSESFVFGGFAINIDRTLDHLRSSFFPFIHIPWITSNRIGPPMSSKTIMFDLCLKY